ncbi:MAG: helix-turn-helix transcriptional regulator [Nocardioidaceae bacterium]|nr:helix-turn-helix transcriptional regulator [Nocardioidaceae bacterium]
MMVDDRLRAILDVIEASLDEPETTGSDLADRAYLSRFHFDRLVSAALGEPPGGFRRRLLLERSAHQLVTVDTPVIDVAMDAGYASPEAFARAFARAYDVSPSDYRRGRPDRHDLPAASGIHFRSPGGLLVPATRRSTSMDIIVRMLDHHLMLVGDIIDRIATLDDAVLDRPIELSVEGIDDSPTLRSTADRLVGQLEMWVTAFGGGTAMPPAGDTTAPGLRDQPGDRRAELPRARHDAGAPRARRRHVRRRRLRAAPDLHVRRRARARADVLSGTPHAGDRRDRLRGYH